MAIEPEAKKKPPEASRLIPCGEETVMDLILKFSSDEAGALPWSMPCCWR